MAKSDTLHMRIDPELKTSLRREARRRSIDVSALVSLVMSEWLARNGRKRVDLSEVDVDGGDEPEAPRSRAKVRPAG